MRAFLFVVLVLLVGCNGNNNRMFNVSLYNISYEVLSNSTESIDEVSFMIQNNEPFSVDCNSTLDINNETNRTAKIGVVGVLDPGEKKQVSMKFEMFSGDSAFSISAECKKQ